MGKVRLNVLGLSYSQTQSGAYALVLAEENGKRRIPVIIGSSEAQSIAIQLEGMTPLRPLTHDLFLSFASAFNVAVLEVNIHKLEEGIFYSEMICSNGAKRVRLDARTSDAVALALRFNCPIYTTEEILLKAGIILESDEESTNEEETTSQKSDSYSEMSLDELKERLQTAIKIENYEEASKIRDEINSRKEKE